MKGEEGNGCGLKNVFGERGERRPIWRPLYYRAEGRKIQEGEEKESECTSGPPLKA